TGDLILSWFLHDDINAAPIDAGFFNNNFACISESEPENHIIVSAIDENLCAKRDTLLIQSISLELENIISSDFQITSYPNPVNGKLLIKGVNQDVIVKVYSSNGELIEVEANYNNVKEILTIKTGRFAPGMYHVLLETESESASISFIKR
ncbi:MAG: T9SS type A sorting domain-containing protein, partial [Bacteroidia bacterium]